MRGEAMERLALSVHEVAEAIGASEASVWRWIRRGELPAARIGGRTFITCDALQLRLGRGRGADHDEGGPRDA